MSRHTISRSSRRLTLLVLITAGMLLSSGPVRAQEDGSASPSPASASEKICTGAYALCTSAPCKRIQSDDESDGKDKKEKATCLCDVVFGVNLGAKECTPASKNPTRGVTHLTSAYSFEQTAQHRLMFCPGNLDYVQCLQAPCHVDPFNPGKARCTCYVVPAPGESWITMGGGCDTSTCGTTLWSGAPADVTGSANDRLLDYLKLGSAADLPLTCCSGVTPEQPDYCWSPAAP